MKRSRREMRNRRHLRRRQKVQGTPERPRLAVQRSLRHIYAQIIDDTSGHTLVSATTATPENMKSETRRAYSNKEFARAIGVEIAERAQKKGVTRVVFDTGGGRYHGCVKELAEAARKGGLEF